VIYKKYYALESALIFVKVETLGKKYLDIFRTVCC